MIGTQKHFDLPFGYVLQTILRFFYEQTIILKNIFSSSWDERLQRNRSLNQSHKKCKLSRPKAGWGPAFYYRVGFSQPARQS